MLPPITLPTPVRHLFRQSHVAHMHRRLGDPVHVHQHRLSLPMPLIPAAQPPQLQSFAAKDHTPQFQLLSQLRPRFFLRLHQLVKRRWRLVQHRHPLFHQQLQKLPRRPRDRPRHHHQTPAIQQRSPHLPHRKIKRIGMKQRPHILGAEAEPALRRRKQTCHVPLRHHHSLRLAR